MLFSFRSRRALSLGEEVSQQVAHNILFRFFPLFLIASLVSTL